LETCEHAVFEAGHGADAVAGQGNDIESDTVTRAAGGAQVGPERGLSIRTFLRSRRSSPVRSLLADTRQENSDVSGACANLTYMRFRLSVIHPTAQARFPAPDAGQKKF